MNIGTVQNIHSTTVYKSSTKNQDIKLLIFLYNIPGILLKTHKTSHSQYTHSFYQSCLTVIDNGSMYLVEY